jgi:hypothetical protein
MSFTDPLGAAPLARRSSFAQQSSMGADLPHDVATRDLTFRG